MHKYIKNNCNKWNYNLKTHYFFIEGCNETIDFDGKTYYVVEGDMDDDEIVVEPFDATPDCYGCYKTVILEVKVRVIVDVKDSDEMFNSTNKELECINYLIKVKIIIDSGVNHHFP